MLKCKLGKREFPVHVWAGEQLGKLYALDTETEMIVEEQTPDLILGSAYDGELTYVIMGKDMAAFLATNMQADQRIIMHTAKFDIAVLEKACPVSFEEMVDEGRLLDIAILYRLIGIAETGQAPRTYNLALITKILIHAMLDKNPLLRTTFGGTLTDDHLVYAAKDAIATFLDAKVLLKQAQVLDKDNNRQLLGHRLQLQADIAMGAMHRQPLHVDYEQARAMRKEIEREMMKQAIVLVENGFNPNVTGTEARFDGVMRKILEEYDAPVIENSKGYISQKAEWLLPCIDHPFVKNFIDFKSNQKLVSTFLKPLVQSRGIIYPAYELLTGTGRTSCRKPNIQQQPRQGGVRDCILAALGQVFLSADYSYIELCTLAQWLINMYGGERELARMINSGQDPHICAAALLLGKSAKSVTKSERQQAKALNFGIAGGLSAASLKGYAKNTYDVDFTDTEAEEVRERYLQLYPDIGDYLKMNWKEVVFPCGRRRGEMGYTDGHNTPFQGLASDGAKQALYINYRQGLSNAIFVHDEIILSTPVADDYTAQAAQLTANMLKGMSMHCPDVYLNADAVVMDRWYKNAEPVLDNGKLMCYTEANNEEKV